MVAVEKNVVEEMNNPLEKMQEEETDRRKMKEKILKEIADEEKCCLILGFPFQSTKKKEIIE